MIAFASAIGEHEPYVSTGRAGMLRAAEPDSLLLEYAATAPVARTYNLLLDAAAQHDDLEALALVAPDTELAGPGFCAQVRAALADSDVALVGLAGGAGGRGLAWWDGEAFAGPVRHHYTELGGGVIPAFAWAAPASPPAEVDVLDKGLLVLSPWAVRELRFDEALGMIGAEADLCLQARAAGRKVTVAGFEAVLHRSLEIIGEPEVWAAAHQRLAAKWERAPESDEGHWRPRARRAEADREASRAMAGFVVLRATEQLERLERRMDELTASRSWRLTAPLRHANRRRRRDS